MGLPVFGPFATGALEIVSLDYGYNLATGETITSVSASIRVADKSSVQDANAATLLGSYPSVNGTVVSAWVGGGPAAATQFVPGCTYLISFRLTTSAGRVPIAEALIVVSPTAPATGWVSGSGASLPSNEFVETANFAPTVAGVYHVTAAVTVTLPSAAFAGTIALVNESTGNLTLTGSALNYYPTLPPGSSVQIVWSVAENGNVLI